MDSGATVGEDLAQAADRMAQRAEHVEDVQLGEGGDPDADPLGADGAALPPAMPVFVNLVERKETAGSRPARSYRAGSGHGHCYVIRFFLVDADGGHHPAATGIDNGDSHYIYSNEPGFPPLLCHNKQDVRRWGEAIIAASQDQAGWHTDVIADEVPPEGVALALPKFISYNETKEELHDGRHRLRWYLLDSEGHNHLALTGEEKDTRDGHYSYHTEPLFEKVKPLEARNQEEVKRWLDSMLAHPQHGAPVAAAAGGGGGGHHHRAAGGGGAAMMITPMALRQAGQRPARPTHPPQRLAATTVRGAGGRFSTPGSVGRGRGRGRGRGPGRPPRPVLPGGVPGSGPARLGGAGAGGGYAAGGGSVVRRGRGGYKLVDPDKEARDLIAAELRRWGLEEAQRREAVKNEALAYISDGLTAEDAAVVARCLPVLKAAAPNAAVPPATATGTPAQRRTLVAALGALRELSHLRATLALAAHPGLKPAIAALAAKGAARPELSALAKSTLEGWLRAAVAQASILADPRYCQDPRPGLEDAITDRPRFDPIVTAITHRVLRRSEPGLPAGFLTPGITGALTPAGQGTPSASAAAGGLPGVVGASEAVGEGSEATEAADGVFKRQRVGPMDSAPSAALVDAPAQPGGDGAEILPPFEQQLAQEGCEF